MKKVKAFATPNITQPMSVELIGQTIKAKRTQSKLRLDDAAALCGVAKQTMMNIEHGSKNTQIGTILQVCASLGIQLSINPWTIDENQSDWQ